LSARRRPDSASAPVSASAAASRWATSCSSWRSFSSWVEGGSPAPSPSRFRHEFASTQTKFRRLGTDLGKAIRSAGSKTDLQLAAEFEKLAARARAQAGSLAKLNAPAKDRSGVKALSAGLDSVANDLGAIGRAARAHDGAKAKAADTALIRDAASFKRVDNALTAKLGLHRKKPKRKH
jgi:hypothetical protein